MSKYEIRDKTGPLCSSEDKHEIDACWDAFTMSRDQFIEHYGTRAKDILKSTADGKFEGDLELVQIHRTYIKP